MWDATGFRGGDCFDENIAPAQRSLRGAATSDHRSTYGTASTESHTASAGFAR